MGLEFRKMENWNSRSLTFLMQTFLFTAKIKVCNKMP